MRRHFTILCCLLAPALCRAATITAENPDLRVDYDDVSHSFSLTEKATGSTFVKGGKLEGSGTTAAAQPATDAVFGSGRKVLVAQADGSIVTLALYEELPFLLVTTERKNGVDAELDLQKVVPATFPLDLATPAAQLKTMGTGGLLPAQENPGSYLFLAVADPATRNGVVSGWVSQNRGSGTVFSGIKDGKVELKAQLEHGHLFLAPGQTTKLDTFAIGWFPDARIGLEQFADAVTKQHHITLRPKTAVYCSWYAEGPDHGRAGTPATTRELAKFIADKKLTDYGLGVIQLDDGWQDGPNIGGPATEFDRVSPKLHYKDGIAPVAKDVEAAGLTFGLWWLPFGRNHMQPEYRDRQDWFYKWPDGKPLRQKSFGGTCIDPTHPAVQQQLESIATAIRSWGVKYYKMDGLVTGAGVDHVYINDGYKPDRFGECQPLHDRSKTNIEALRLGLQTIRKGAGDDVFFSGCCAVQNMRMYAGTIGLVDSMRVGPDFNHDGEGIRSGPLRGSRVYFLNGRVWWNDPDPTKVRTSTETCVGDSSINGAVTLEQARMTSSWVSLTNQFFLISDWLPNLPEERLDILKRTMAPHQAVARPVDYFDNSLANTWLVTDTASGVRRDVIGTFNFYGTPLKIDHSLAKLGLDPAKTYHAFDFWANQPLPDIKGSYQDTLPANACRVIALRAVEGRPVLLSTSRHVTQGMIEITAEKWEQNALSGTSTIIANDPYELRIHVPDGWVLDQTTARWTGNQDEIVQLTTTTTTSPGLARMTITGPATGPISWKISFKLAPKTSGAAIKKLQAAPTTAATPTLPIPVSQL